MKRFEEDLRKITPNVRIEIKTNAHSKIKTEVFYIDNVPFVTNQSHLDFRRKEGFYEKDLQELKKYVMRFGEPF